MHNERCVLGTAGLGGVWGKVSAEESVDTLLEALESGVHAIDTAPAYGDAETYVGKALRSWRGERPIISSKVGRLKSYGALEGYYDFSETGMQQSVEQSLNVLGISALDILFLHDPNAIQPGEVSRVIDSLRAFKGKGYARRIGLGGNPPPWFDKYLEPGTFDVLMEFNKLNACSTVALEENLPLCIQNEMQYFAASPLHMGLLGSSHERFTLTSPEWLDAKHIDSAKRIKTISDNHAMHLHTIAHRFLLSIPYNFQIVIGPSNREELKHTLRDFADGPLPDELFLEVINSIKKSTINV